MNNNFIWFIICTAIFIFIIIFLSIYFKIKIEGILPIILSIGALIISLLTLLRFIIFPANLEIISGSNIILNPDEKGNLNFGIILPITFVNKGFGDCGIESIGLKLFKEDTIEIFFEPLLEIDIEEYIQDKRKVHGTNVLRGFNSFNLFGRTSKNIDYLFSQKVLDSNTNDELETIGVGTYKGELYVKTFNDKKLILRKTFNFNLNEKIINDLNKGNSSYIMNFKYIF